MQADVSTRYFSGRLYDFENGSIGQKQRNQAHLRKKGPQHGDTLQHWLYSLEYDDCLSLNKTALSSQQSGNYLAVHYSCAVCQGCRRLP